MCDCRVCVCLSYVCVCVCEGGSGFFATASECMCDCRVCVCLSCVYICVRGGSGFFATLYILSIMVILATTWRRVRLSFPWNNSSCKSSTYVHNILHSSSDQLCPNGSIPPSALTSSTARVSAFSAQIGKFLGCCEGWFFHILRFFLGETCARPCVQNASVVFYSKKKNKAEYGTKKLLMFFPSATYVLKVKHALCCLASVHFFLMGIPVFQLLHTLQNICPIHCTNRIWRHVRCQVVCVHPLHDLHEVTICKIETVRIGTVFCRRGGVRIF